MLGLGIGIPRISRVSIAIGDTYQGGLVFYLDGSGGGLISAPANETNTAWGCHGSVISGADGTAIGTGAQNTIDIVAGCTSEVTAADRCSDKDDGTYDDWFLPSYYEAKAMYDNLHAAGLGSFTSGGYWTSTEHSATNAYVQYFNNGSLGTYFKTAALSVRAIRSF